MIKQAVREIIAHFRLPSPLGRDAAGWAAAILVPFLLLTISLLPRAFGQSRGGGSKFATTNSSAGEQTRQSLGAREGDLIQEVNKQRVKSAKDLVAASKKLKPNEKILIRVYSQGRSGYVALEPK
jgi:S1-C subfamily serine protease